MSHRFLLLLLVLALASSCQESVTPSPRFFGRAVRWTDVGASVPSGLSVLIARGRGALFRDALGSRGRAEPWHDLVALQRVRRRRAHPPVAGTFASPAAKAAAIASDSTYRAKQANVVRRAAPIARVVDVPGALHYVFLTNEADVVHEINAFLKSLPDGHER